MIKNNRLGFRQQNEYEQERFEFNRDFYTKINYWGFQTSFLLRTFAFIFAIIYYPYKFIIFGLDLLGNLITFDLNFFVTIKQKKYQLRQCEKYLQIFNDLKATRN